MSAIRYIIFDLGSTLIHFEGDWPTVFAEADQILCNSLEDLGLGHFNAAFSQDFRIRMERHYRRREKDYIETPTTAILAETLEAAGYLEPSSKILQAAVDTLYKASQANWQLEGDATPALLSLQKMGCRLGILSNAGDDNDVQTLVKNTGLQDIFDFVISSAAIGTRKPDPRVFEISLAQWGASPDQAIMVGDTLDADILGANNAGIHSVWITRRADRPENMANQGRIIPDSVIQTLSELPAMVRNLG